MGNCGPLFCGLYVFNLLYAVRTSVSCMAGAQRARPSLVGGSSQSVRGDFSSDSSHCSRDNLTHHSPKSWEGPSECFTPLPPPLFTPRCFGSKPRTLDRSLDCSWVPVRPLRWLRNLDPGRRRYSQDDEPCERRRGRRLSKLGVSVSGLSRRSGGDKQMHWPFSSKQITLYHKECLVFAMHHQKATDWFGVIRKKKTEEWLQGKCATERAFRSCRRLQVKQNNV